MAPIDIFIIKHDHLDADWQAEIKKGITANEHEKISKRIRELVIKRGIGELLKADARDKYAQQLKLPPEEFRKVTPGVHSSGDIYFIPKARK